MMLALRHLANQLRRDSVSGMDIVSVIADGTDVGKEKWGEEVLAASWLSPDNRLCKGFPGSGFPRVYPVGSKIN
jgi:hypothetical protein